MKVRITPAGGYAHGHIETLLIQLGITPPPRHPDGIVEMELTQGQLDMFSLRGGAHKVEKLPDPVAVIPPPEVATNLYNFPYPTVPLPPDPAPAATQAPSHSGVPTLEDLMAKGMSKQQAKKAIWRAQSEKK